MPEKTMTLFKKTTPKATKPSKKITEVVKKSVKKSDVLTSAAVPHIELFDTPASSCFLLHQGGVLCNVHDLIEALDFMSLEQFNFHTKREGNDFANWLRDVFGYESLADFVEMAKTRKRCAAILREAIA